MLHLVATRHEGEHQAERGEAKQKHRRQPKREIHGDPCGTWSDNGYEILHTFSLLSAVAGGRKQFPRQ